MEVKNSVFFEKIKGKNIFCYLSEPEKNNKKIIIMSHGFRGSTIGPARTFVDFSRILNKEGYSILRFDHLNSGNSDGDYLNSSFNEWVDTIIYFTEKYFNQGYKVSLFGQSMGAAATMIAASNKKINNKIPCILLWVPDPEEDCTARTGEIHEENGQKYNGTFFVEAKNADFFGCLNKYSGRIHLVYGDKDKYVSEELRVKVANKVKAKNKDNQVMTLKNQDHSPWEFDIAQEVYRAELSFLNNFLK